MARTRSIEVGLLTSRSIGDRLSGRYFLELLCSLGDGFSPERYNDHEPINVPFDPENIEDALRMWGKGFFWRPRKRSLLGRAWSGGNDVHDAVYLSVPTRSFDLDLILHFFAEMEKRFGVDLAYIHTRTDRDTEDLDYYQAHLMPFSQGVTTHHLRNGLPGVAWGMLFGPPYLEILGREKLLGAPASLKKEIGQGVYLQLSTDVTDSVTKFEEYSRVRKTTRDYLNQGAFHEPGVTLPRRIPSFLSGYT